MSDQPTKIPDQPHTPLDPTPYLRTYAQDMAAITGGRKLTKDDTRPTSVPTPPTPVATPSSQPAQQAAVAPKPVVAVHPAATQSPVPKPIAISPELPRMQPVMPAPHVEPSAELPSVAANQKEIGAARESVLARLRAKAANHATPAESPLPEVQPVLPAPNVTPTEQSLPQTPPSEPLPEVKPVLPTAPVATDTTPVPETRTKPTVHDDGSFVVVGAVRPEGTVSGAPPVFHEPETRPVPPLPPITRPTPAPRPQPVPNEPERIHTYKSDFSDRIDKQGASVFSVLAAQRDAPRTVPQSTTPLARKRLYIAVGLVFVVAGIGGLYVAFSFLHKSPVAVAPSAASLIVVDERTEVAGTGATLLQSLADAAAAPLPQGNVRLTYLTVATTTATGVVKEPQSGGTLMSALQLPAPEILLRNIDPASTIGVVHAGTETRPFFLLRVSSYERTFAGMLAWEPTMMDTFSILYPQYTEQSVTLGATATTTMIATTSLPTQTATPLQIAPGSFVDAVVANHDVRILRDATGRSLVLYGYIDKQTLLIARNEAAFTEILSRLTAGSTQ